MKPSSLLSSNELQENPQVTLMQRLQVSCAALNTMLQDPILSTQELRHAHTIVLEVNGSLVALPPDQTLPAKKLYESYAFVVTINNLLSELVDLESAEETSAIQHKAGTKGKKSKQEKAARPVSKQVCLEEAQRCMALFNQKKASLLDFFFWNGNLASFKIIYALISENELLNALKKWFEPLMKKRKSTYSKETISIFNFLMENSEAYKSHLSELEKTTFFDSQSEKRYFFIMYAYIRDDLELFKMFLDHGFEPNSGGCFLDENTCLSVLKTILINNNARNHLYIQCLLQKGATLVLEDLWFMAQRQDWKSVSMMAAHADMLSVTLVLGYLSCTEDFAKFFVCHESGLGVGLYKSQQDLLQGFQKADKKIEQEKTQALPDRNRNYCRLRICYNENNPEAWEAMFSLYSAFLKQQRNQNVIVDSLKELECLLQKRQLQENALSDRDVFFIYNARLVLITQKYSQKPFDLQGLTEILNTYHHLSHYASSASYRSGADNMIEVIAESFTHFTLAEETQNRVSEARQRQQVRQSIPKSMLFQSSTYHEPSYVPAESQTHSTDTRSRP